MGCLVGRGKEAGATWLWKISNCLGHLRGENYMGFPLHVTVPMEQSIRDPSAFP